MMDIDRSFGTDIDGWCSLGPVGFAYRGLCTTDESTGDYQPRSDRESTCCIVADARIDNRSELIRALQPDFSLDVSAGDSGLILAAYKRWGHFCASRLLGDFAFVIWDANARKLLCVRDALGVRPFFYIFDGRAFVFASFIRQLVRSSYYDSSLDDEHIANFLARGDCPSELTPYRNIRRLMPGCLLSIENGSLKKEKYWDLDSSTAIRYRTDEEYDAHFLQLFTNAVKVRTRATHGIAAELSGGLDSSSIVSVAARHKTHIVVYTDVYESVQARETRWSDAVVHKYNLESIQLIADDRLLLTDTGDEVECWDEPTLKNLALPNLRARGRAVSEHKLKVLLSGIGGDQLLLSGPRPYHLADLFRCFQWRRLFREAFRWQAVLGEPLASVLTKYCFTPLLHPNVVFSPWEPSERMLPPWINAQFSHRYKIRDRMLNNKGFLPRHYRSPAHQRQYLNIMRTSAMLVQGYMMNAPIEVRYPYLDRLLVEFCMSIPMEQKQRPDDSRSILRRAMRGILPELVRVRTSKAWFQGSLLTSITKQRPIFDKWVASSDAVRRGYLDRAELRRELEMASVGFSRNAYLFLAAIALELWLRGFERQSQSSGSCRNMFGCMKDKATSKPNRSFGFEI